MHATLVTRTLTPTLALTPTRTLTLTLILILNLILILTLTRWREATARQARPLRCSSTAPPPIGLTRAPTST